VKSGRKNKYKKREGENSPQILVRQFWWLAHSKIDVERKGDRLVGLKLKRGGSSHCPLG